jgi:hypothetical protein
MHATMPIVAPREGDRVVAQDGDLGCVDRVLRSEAARAIYLVVAVGAVGRRKYPVIHCGLVESVDRAERTVYVRGRRSSLQRLPESPPIVI